MAFKMPDFWTSDPEAWFFRAEAVFRRARTTDQATKFDHVVTRLPETTITALRDILAAAAGDSAEAPYDQLKERLLNTFGKSDYQKCSELLTFPPAHDQKPTVTLNAMLALLPPGEKTGVLFQTLFLHRLPPFVHDLLAHRKFDSVQALALEAYKIFSTRRPDAAAICAVNRRAASPQRRRSPSRQARPRRRQTPGPREDGLCFYHGRFGDRAQRCEGDCQWQGNGGAASGN